MVMYGLDYGRRMRETHYAYVDKGKHLVSSKEINYRDDYQFAEPVIRYRLYKEGSIMELKSYSVQDSTVLRELRYERDSLNRKIYSLHNFYTFSHIPRTEEYIAWNNLGFKELIESVETSSTTGVQKRKKEVIRYKYDEMNNWTERTITIDGHLRTFAFRKITYYNEE